MTTSVSAGAGAYALSGTPNPVISGHHAVPTTSHTHLLHSRQIWPRDGDDPPNRQSVDLGQVAEWSKARAYKAHRLGDAATVQGLPSPARLWPLRC